MSLSSYLSAFDDRDWETDASGTVRFALVGLGWWTVDEALPAVADSDFCEATVFVSSSREKARDVAADVDTAAAALTYEAFHDGAASGEYDAVYVCTPNATHLEFTRTAAELGKDVLTEKPMEATAPRAAEMVRVCEAEDVALAVGYRMQTEPVIRRVRDLVRDGVIGDPRFVHSENTQRLLDIFADPDQWRLDPELTGYGSSVMDLGIYSINTTRFLLDADPVAVQATMRSEHDAFDDVPDERAALLVEYEGGVDATFTTSQRAHDGSYLELTGTDGRVRIEPAFHMETDFRLTVDDRTVDVDTPTTNQMTEIFDYAAHGFLTDTPLELDGAHGLVDMQTVAAAHAAAGRGERVRVDEK
ncbi:D-xylose 1-dehydrogenase Gfo6 [Halocalculus aciditolerans]|uniref:Glucose-fructose oxidoreductase n=1 Tax=Halocalculus aciditolerans TaxID=1383812 RepID=A0A830F633_9EURY|nr:D-xylose 1-dehydrogenase Gfo6 [Halocalculus aciditolerans]GGL66954.1 glucose-fructose oxidoreductase [Halocalculus aciditolerans]